MKRLSLSTIKLASKSITELCLKTRSMKLSSSVQSLNNAFSTTRRSRSRIKFNLSKVSRVNWMTRRYTLSSYKSKSLKSKGLSQKRLMKKSLGVLEEETK